MHSRLVREHTFHEISIRFRLQRQVENTLIPALNRPSHTLAQIVDGTPVSQPEHLIAVHFIEVRTHRSRACLTLIERLFRIALHVAREVHIPIIIGIYLGCHSQISWNRISIQIAIARMHGHGSETGVVVAMEQLLLQFISRHAPVVERQIGILLQFITQTPEHHRRMISISLHPFRNILLPETLPIYSATGILRQPLIIEFIHYENTQSVAKSKEVFAIGIMGSSHMIESKLFHHLESLLDGTWIGCCT